ncbi:MAG: fibronectin type III domain-containing protein [Euryarchaeota archaeon]|nr:fibronectin type III domain-containing protein [Euryarchaeota archaeon]
MRWRTSVCRGVALLAAAGFVLLLFGTMGIRAPPKFYEVRVTDGGTPVPGAFVNLTAMARGDRWSGTTDAQGIYRFQIGLMDPDSVPMDEPLTITASKDGKVGTSQFTPALLPALEHVAIALGANPPTQAVQLGTIATSDTYMDINWTKSQAPDFAKYVIYLSRSEGDVGIAAWSATNIATTACRIPNLEPGTRYYVRVAVEDAAGADALSEQAMVTTTGLPANAGYVLLVVIIVIAAVVAAFMLMRRRRSSRSETRAEKRQRGRRGE